MVEEKDLESKQEGEEKSSSQDNSTDETKDNSQTEDDTSQKTEENEGQEDDFVKVPKKEFETYQKKASDFDGLIEKKRLEKLYKKNTTEEQKDDGDGSQSKEIDESKISKIVEEKVAIELQKRESVIYTDNLKDAYRDFIKENPWADDDNVMAEISQKFNPDGKLNKEDLLDKIKIAAQNAFPKHYNEAMESGIRKKILLETRDIDAGDAGSGGSSDRKDFKESPSVKATKDDQRIADRFFNGDVNAYLKYKQEENK